MKRGFNTVFLAVLLVARPCFAQPTAAREAQAEELFQRGKERMVARDLAKACALFG